jgi:hypothetical protein
VIDMSDDAITQELRALRAIEDIKQLKARHCRLVDTMDWAAWAETWQTLDTGPVAALLHGPQDSMLTLCGERFAQTFGRAAPSWRQSWRGAFGRMPVHAVLAAL